SLITFVQHLDLCEESGGESILIHEKEYVALFYRIYNALEGCKIEVGYFEILFNSVKREYLSFLDVILNNREFSSFDVVCSWNGLLINAGNSYSSIRSEFLTNTTEKIYKNIMQILVVNYY
ncbi:40648_t:CDS:1, partial [Gigaspora margarita]